jgi:hypothetical protein
VEIPIWHVPNKRIGSSKPRVSRIHTVNVSRRRGRGRRARWSCVVVGSSRHTRTHTHTHTHTHVCIHTYILYHISAQEKSDKTAVPTNNGGEGGSPRRVILSLAPSTAPLWRNVTLNVIEGENV